jgi:cardiolipin synthase
MIHCKVMVVDGIWVSAGSCNFDDRSLRLNDEANLNVFDPEFARAQLERIELDLRQSRRVSAPRWALDSLRQLRLILCGVLVQPLDPHQKMSLVTT